MDETAKLITQDAYDDCCICLEPFSVGDPLEVTNCKHDFHLRCILQWGRRSAQCPLCWQLLSLKEPASQEQLEDIERRRSFESEETQNTINLATTVSNDTNTTNYMEAADIIFQYTISIEAALVRAHDRNEPLFAPSSPVDIEHEPVLHAIYNRISDTQHASTGARVSDMKAFSELLKARLNALSLRCRKYAAKIARGLKGKLFSRNASEGLNKRGSADNVAALN